jgi:hypothetical protein
MIANLLQIRFINFAFANSAINGVAAFVLLANANIKG